MPLSLGQSALSFDPAPKRPSRRPQRKSLTRRRRGNGLYVQLQHQESSSGSSSGDGTPTSEWSGESEHASSGGSQAGSESNDEEAMSEGGDSEDNDSSESNHLARSIFELHPFRSFALYSRPSSSPNLKALGDLARCISTTFLDEYGFLDDAGMAGIGGMGGIGGMPDYDPSLILHCGDDTGCESAIATATASASASTPAAGEEDWRDVFTMLCCDEEAATGHHGFGGGGLMTQRYPSTSSLARMFE